MKNKSLNNSKIARIAILVALDVVLQFIANYITIGGVSITLSLIIIVLAACIEGRFTGAFIGFINGIIVLLAPSTITLFFPVNPIGTIFICLFKMAAAGYIAGLIFTLMKNKKPAVILASLIVPIVNTGLFALFTPILFNSILVSLTPEGVSTTYFLIFGFIGFNFIIELFINALLASTAYYIIKSLEKRRRTVY